MNRCKIIIAVVLLLCLFLSGCSKSEENATNTTTAATGTAAAAQADKKSKKTAAAAKKETTSPVKTDKTMEKTIRAQIPQDNGKWSVYYKNLKDQTQCSISNEKTVSASLIKLFIMATVYDQINQKKLKDSKEIEDLMEKMITVSDNDASNDLVKILADGDHKAGMKVVNAYAKNHGFPHTEQQRDMRDSRPKPVPEQNYTSVEDCGKLLELIYSGKCVSKTYSEKMLGYLLQQTRTHKIPAGLPKGTKVANKTGELEKTENDVAIVYTEKADYILCVMSNDITSKDDAQQSIREISEAVYEQVTK
ncbi:MAG: serine hydrolase [Clostridia bacterium]|nr:serine hydrolase [Clostridia bacterium]